MPLDLVKLGPLMHLTSGRAEIVIGLIDGPVAIAHPELVGENIQEIGGASGGCARLDSVACAHGTFVAGVLLGKRGASAPGICPSCTLLIRPVFGETTAAHGELPIATPAELGRAILDCLEAGVRLVNISAALAETQARNERAIEEAVDQAARRGMIVVVAAGNESTLGSTAITRHRWVIPVVAYDRRGRPAGGSTLGHSIGRRGLGAVGDRITSLGAAGEPLTLSGTSAAAPFVTGAIALLWSLVPTATAVTVKSAVMQRPPMHRSTVVPPLMDAWAAQRAMGR